MFCVVIHGVQNRRLFFVKHYVLKEVFCTDSPGFTSFPISLLVRSSRRDMSYFLFYREGTRYSREGTRSFREGTRSEAETEKLSKP